MRLLQIIRPQHLPDTYSILTDMTNITQALHWRYATKQFDTTKKLSDDTVNALKESIQMSPSSFGLQPYKILNVTNPEIREKLKAAAWGQTQLTDASHLFVFAVPADITDTDVDAFISLNMSVRGSTAEDLAGYSSMIKGSVNSRTSEQKQAWAAKQAYIALGFLLETAALLEVDATPMEGFDAGQFDEILGLKEKNLKSVVICALGYRSAEDTYANLPKVRASAETLFLNM